MDDSDRHPPANACHVTPHDGGWAVKCAETESATGVYATQGEALRAAQSMMRRTGGETFVHGTDGRVRETYTLGTEAFARISEIEGLSASRDAQKRAAEFDRRGLSPAERRAAIIEAFRSKS